MIYIIGHYFRRIIPNGYYKSGTLRIIQLCLVNLEGATKMALVARIVLPVGAETGATVVTPIAWKASYLLSWKKLRTYCAHRLWEIRDAYSGWH